MSKIEKGERLLVVSSNSLLNLGAEKGAKSLQTIDVFAAYLLKLHNCGFQVLAFLAPRNFLTKMQEKYITQARAVAGLMDAQALREEVVGLSENKKDWVRIASKITDQLSEPFSKKRVVNHFRQGRMVLYVPDPSEIGVGFDVVVESFREELECDQVIKFPLGKN